MYSSFTYSLRRIQSHCRTKKSGAHPRPWPRVNSPPPASQHPPDASPPAPPPQARRTRPPRSAGYDEVLDEAPEKMTGRVKERLCAVFCRRHVPALVPRKPVLRRPKKDNTSLAFWPSITYSLTCKIKPCHDEQNPRVTGPSRIAPTQRPSRTPVFPREPCLPGWAHFPGLSNVQAERFFPLPVIAPPSRLNVTFTHPRQWRQDH